jgi:hypothetical protein
LKTINFRKATEEDIPQLVDLMNSEYSRKKNESYFLWQYFDSYYPTILMCAFDNRKLVGMFGLQKRMLENGINVGQAIDLLIAHDWRGKGIFNILGDKATNYFSDIDIFCVLPNLNGKIAVKKNFGWRTLAKVNSMYLYNEKTKDQEEFIKENNACKEREYNKFKYNTESRAWRFDNHPNYNYSYISIGTGELAITKVYQDPITGQKYGDIVDFECNLFDKKNLRELFLKASSHLKHQKIRGITTWALPYTPLRSAVESLGFTEVPQERYFCIKVLKPEYENLYDLSKWHLVQADAEIY